MRLIYYIFTVTLLSLSSLALADPIPFDLPARSELSKLRSARISTDRGDIYLELFPEEAPWHVANFKYLADKGFYRGLLFHSYFSGYMIQGGDPQNNGKGGPGYSLPAEFSDHKHQAGTLGMARSADYINPERLSNGSQFNILLGSAPQMDGLFTIFGQVRKGMDIVNELRKGDRITSIKVYVKE